MVRTTGPFCAMAEVRLQNTVNLTAIPKAAQSAFKIPLHYKNPSSSLNYPARNISLIPQS